MNNELLKEKLKNTALINEYLDIADIASNEFSDIDKLNDYIEARINEVEIIYYSNAIQFLSENDNSLRESLELAGELGYEIKDINSELLAGLLLQSKLREELSGLDLEEVL